jgi:hypothetical protein
VIHLSATKAKVGLGVLLPILLVVGAATLGATNPEQANVQACVKAAIADIYGAGSITEASPARTTVDAAMATAARVDLDTRLRAHLTGTALGAWLKSLGAAIDEEAMGQAIVANGGGIDAISFDATSVSGTSATASGRAQVWRSWVDPTTTGTGRPTMWESFSATLVQQNGSWMVADIQFDQLPNVPIVTAIPTAAAP